MQPTVFLVDDDQAVRESLRFLMKSVGQPLKCYATAQEFLDDFDQRQPGCLVLDVRMPGMSGLELIDHLAKMDCNLPIIIITGHADVPMAVRVMKAGALDVLEKPFNDQMLLDCIHKAFNENLKIRKKKDERFELGKLLKHLTPREREVMNALIEGKNNKEIAEQFGISRKTVSVHRIRVLRKMRVESMTDLVRLLMAVKELDTSN